MSSGDLFLYDCGSVLPPAAGNTKDGYMSPALDNSSLM